MAKENNETMCKEVNAVILASRSVSKRVRDEIGISEAGLSKAFRFNMNGELAERARALAESYGAKKYVPMPDFETNHDEMGMMIQTFRNGAIISVDRNSDTMKIEHEGKKIAEFYTTAMSHLLYAQLIASKL